MKKVQTLNVYASPSSGVLVSDLEAYAVKVRRFVGWEHDGSLGPDGGFRAKVVPTTLHVTDNTHLAEYIRALKDGELLPADEATAKASGTILKPSKDAKQKETKTQ